MSPEPSQMELLSAEVQARPERLFLPLTPGTGRSSQPSLLFVAKKNEIRRARPMPKRKVCPERTDRQSSSSVSFDFFASSSPTGETSEWLTTDWTLLTPGPAEVTGGTSNLFKSQPNSSFLEFEAAVVVMILIQTKTNILVLGVSLRH